MIENMNQIIKQKEKHIKYNSPYIPKNKATDNYGFSQ